MGWAAARPERTWAIEGATGLGHLLARQLVPAGEQVLDIQPKVAGRVRLRGLASTGHRMSGSVPPPTVSISLSPRRIVGRETVDSASGPASLVLTGYGRRVGSLGPGLTSESADAVRAVLRDDRRPGPRFLWHLPAVPV
jgi:hypothetical protein